MKKITVLFCLLSAVALAAVWQAPALTALAAGQSAVTLTEPPALTVSCGEESVSLWSGNYNWEWKSGEEMQGVIACGASPLDVLENLPELSAKPGDQLTFDASPLPDELLIRIYFVPEITDITFVETEEISLSGENTLTVPEDGVGRVYEILGTWNSLEDCGGSACYAFAIK